MQKLAHFSGPWHEEDRAALLETIRAVDAEATAGNSASSLVCFWTCNLYPSERGALMTASRMGTGRLFTARSIEDLTARIRAVLAPTSSEPMIAAMAA